MRIFADKQDGSKKMNSIPNINTIELLNSRPDAVYILFSNLFRIIKPVRSKYKLPVNSIVVLNNLYLYHCYKGSMVTHRQLYLLTGYYDKGRIQYYIDLLIEKGYVIQSDVIKDIKYYRITLAGMEVIKYFNETYQSQLSKFCQDHKIDL